MLVEPTYQDNFLMRGTLTIDVLLNGFGKIGALTRFDIKIYPKHTRVKFYPTTTKQETDKDRQTNKNKKLGRWWLKGLVLVLCSIVRTGSNLYW
jgi:hypothetical protein